MTLPLTTYTRYCYTPSDTFADWLKISKCKSSDMMNASIADTIVLQAIPVALQERYKRKKCYLWHMGAGAPQIGE